MKSFVNIFTLLGRNMKLSIKTKRDNKRDLIQTKIIKLLFLLHIDQSDIDIERKDKIKLNWREQS